MESSGDQESFGIELPSHPGFSDIANRQSHMTAENLITEKTALMVKPDGIPNVMIPGAQ